MKLNEAYPSKYLKASDFDAGPQPATIEKVEIEEIGPRKDQKPVVHFSNLDKSMVLNKTNWKTITRALGSEDTDDWVGKTITLYSAEVEFQGEMVEAIRVRLKKTQPDSDGEPLPF